MLRIYFLEYFLLTRDGSVIRLNVVLEYYLSFNFLPGFGIDVFFVDTESFPVFLTQDIEKIFGNKFRYSMLLF